MMATPDRNTPLPTPHATDDRAPSRLQLPPGPWATVLDGLCARFPSIDRERWLDRMARGLVLDADGDAIDGERLYRRRRGDALLPRGRGRAGIPFDEVVLHVDEHLVVADKPHFLPVMPAGGFVRETLLARLVRRLGNRELVPLHRIDRDTAGLVLFSANPDSRAAYQALFRDAGSTSATRRWRRPLPGRRISRCCGVRDRAAASRSSACAKDEGRGQQRDADRGARARAKRLALCAEPVTGRKHQLRVHMAALGAPILGDPFYPVLAVPAADDYAHPLKLLAKSLAFVDPLTGEPRRFESRQSL